MPQTKEERRAASDAVFRQSYPEQELETGAAGISQYQEIEGKNKYTLEEKTHFQPNSPPSRRPTRDPKQGVRDEAPQLPLSPREVEAIRKRQEIAAEEVHSRGRRAKAMPEIATVFRETPLPQPTPSQVREKRLPQLPATEEIKAMEEGRSQGHSPSTDESTIPGKEERIEPSWFAKVWSFLISPLYIFTVLFNALARLRTCGQGRGQSAARPLPYEGT